MAIPLQKVPPALLGALDMKALGLNPSALGDTVGPVVELLDHYVQNFTAVELAQQAVQTTGQQATLNVPQGELWRVRAVSAIMIIAAGITVDSDYVGISPGINLSNSFGAVRLGQTNLAAPSGALTEPLALCCGLTCDRPFLLRSGNQITGQFFGELDTAEDLFLTAWFERIPL